MIDAFYEMNEEGLRMETVGNLEVYFCANNARGSAAWNEDEYLVYFSGNIAEREVEKMVQPIFFRRSEWDEAAPCSPVSYVGATG